MPTATESDVRGAQTGAEELRFLIDEVAYQVRNAGPRVDVMSERDPTGRTFGAGASDAFPSGWPLRHVGEVRWELDGSYYLG